MAAYTSVYSNFVTRLDEVQLLRVRAAALERGRNSLRHGPEISAICRGSIVLLSSHIEGYVKEVGELALDSIVSKGLCRSRLKPEFFYHASRTSLVSLRDANDPAVIAENVFRFLESDLHHWSRQDKFPQPLQADTFSKGFANPSFDKVKSYLGRFGYTEFRPDFFRELKRDAQIVENAIDSIVASRNAIAHGDLGTTKTPAELQSMIDVSKLFCRTVDRLFATWCRKNICSIR